MNRDQTPRRPLAPAQTRPAPTTIYGTVVHGSRERARNGRYRAIGIRHGLSDATSTLCGRAVMANGALLPRWFDRKPGGSRRDVSCRLCCQIIGRASRPSPPPRLARPPRPSRPRFKSVEEGRAAALAALPAFQAAIHQRLAAAQAVEP